MPAIASDLQWRLSGGASNADPSLSIGGAMSSTQVNGATLFPTLTEADCIAGGADYRIVYAYNAGSASLYIPAGFLSANTASPMTTVAIALGNAGLNATEPALVNASTAPSPAVAFTTASTDETGVDLPTIPAGGRIAMVLRRTWLAGAPTSADVVHLRMAFDDVDPFAVPGPMDLYTGDLWWAMSLSRRMVGAYTGPVFRVVSSAGGNPAFDIYGADSTALAVACAAVLGASSGYLSRIYNQAGPGYFEQTTYANMPKVYDAGTFLGLARFDGSNDWMVSSVGIGSSGPAAISVFAKKFYRTTGDGMFLELTNSTGGSGSTAGAAIYAGGGGGTQRDSLSVSQGNAVGGDTYNGANSLSTVMNYIIDKSEATEANRTRAWSAGTALTLLGGFATVPSGTFFSDSPVYIGSRGAGASLIAAIDIEEVSIYLANKSTDRSAIVTALT